jgi:hypothetical protein
MRFVFLSRCLSTSASTVAGALRCAIAIAIAIGVGGCSERLPATAIDSGLADTQRIPDTRSPDTGRCDPSGDEDKDGISNGIEGCLEGRDTDNDGVEDWRDLDSDGDSVLDGHEDKDGDGLVGCCLERCGKPAPSQLGCKLNAEGCGDGQRCANGLCAPAADCRCAAGETSPTKKSSFDDGVYDNERAGHVCCNGLFGPAALTLHRSAKPQPSAPGGDWTLALRPSAQVTPLAIKQVTVKEGVTTIDYRGASELVAGFVISLPDAGTDDLYALQQTLLSRLSSKLTGQSVTVRGLGIASTTHDRYRMLRDLSLDLAGPAAPLTATRDRLLAALIDRPAADLLGLPPSFGPKAAKVSLRLSLVQRYAFARDASGKALLDASGQPRQDPQRPDARRLLLIGAVAATSDVEDGAKDTATILRDLAGGTALARFDDSLEPVCAQQTITRLPKTDLIWVMDDSGSAAAKRDALIPKATKAIAATLPWGLDLRVGVTNVVDTAQPTMVGKFCSRSSPKLDDAGGVDRFLTLAEASTIEACLRNPPGQSTSNEFGLSNAEQAVLRHLPRAANAPEKIRLDAALELVIFSDEPSAELLAVTLPHQHSCAPVPGLDAALKPFVDTLSGSNDSQARARVHAIVPVCGNRCGVGVGITHAYLALAREREGLVADICQQDFGGSLELLIEQIIGRSLPLRLEHTPVAASLRVALDGLPTARSRKQGFGFFASEDSLGFVDLKWDKGSSATLSYRRWRRQLSPP